MIGGFLLASKGSIDYPCLSTRWLGCHWLWRRVVCLKLHRQGYRQKDGKDEESGAGKGLISPAVSLVYATLLGIAGLCCCGLARIRWPAGWG